MVFFMELTKTLSFWLFSNRIFVYPYQNKILVFRICNHDDDCIDAAIVSPYLENWFERIEECPKIQG